MRSRCTSRSTAFSTLKVITTLAAITAIGLACSAATSRADITKMLPQGEASQAGTPRQVLPALSNPRPLRQGVLAPCSTNTLIGANTCILNFAVVPAGRVVQIDKMNCIGGNDGAAILFNTQIGLTASRLMGFVLPPFTGAGSSAGSGPYYFLAGERPIIAASRNTPTESTLCTISGTFWLAS